ncbi:hypothetical protein ACSSS7_006769 [Eimeria intestinalis]
MARFARLVPRLVNNLRLRLTQTNRVCAKQLLDSALLAPAVTPSTSVRASHGEGGVQIQQHAEISAEFRPSILSRSWAAEFAHAESPAGILQYLFLTLRGNTCPQEFLEELSRFLLHDEPLAPPVAAFWQLWTSNDLAIFYKLLLAHGVDDAALFAQIRAYMARSLQHFSPADAAVVLAAAAEAPDSRLTLELLHHPILDATAAAAAEAHRGGALTHASVSDSVRVFFAVSRVYDQSLRGSAASVGQQTQAIALSSPPHSEAESLPVGDASKMVAAWASSLEPLALLSQHLRGCVPAASPRATLRSESQEPRLSLHAAVAAALNDAGSHRTTSVAGSGGVCGRAPRTAGEGRAPLLHEGKLQCVWREALGACKAVKLDSGCGGERTVEQETDRQPQEANCEHAVYELLTVAVPALSETPEPFNTSEAGNFSRIVSVLISMGALTKQLQLRPKKDVVVGSLLRSSADLSTNDCLSLLELLWPLAVSPSFSLPFRWVEGQQRGKGLENPVHAPFTLHRGFNLSSAGLLFHLAAQAHCLSPSSLLALAAFAEVCLARDGGGDLAYLASDSGGSKELHVQRMRKQGQVQDEVVVGGFQSLCRFFKRLPALESCDGLPYKQIAGP